MIKFLKRLVLAILALLLILAAVVVLAVSHPEWILRPEVLRWAARKLEAKGISVTWKEVRLSIEGESLFTKRIDISFDDLCVRDSKYGSWGGCFKRFDAGAKATFVRLKPKLLEIGPLTATGGDLRIEPELAPPSQNESKKAAKDAWNPEKWVPALVRSARILPVEVSIDRFLLIQGKETTSGSLTLTKGPTEKSGAEEISLGARVKAGSIRVESRAELKNPEGIWAWDRWSIDLLGEAKLPKKTLAKIGGQIRPRFKTQGQPESAKTVLELDYDLHASYLDPGPHPQGGRLVEAKASGSAAPNRLTTRITGSAKNFSEVAPLIRIRDCALSTERTRDQEATLEADCPIRARVPLPAEKLALLSVPAEIGGTFRAKVQSPDLIPDDKSQVKGEAQMILDPVLSPLFRGEGDLRSTFDGVVGEFPKKGQADAMVNLWVEVPEFGKLVERLDRTIWSIPAPMRVLRGSLRLEGHGASDLNSGSFPLRLQTRLASKTQSADILATSDVEIERLRLKPQVDVKAEVLLTNLQIELPRLELAKPPKFFPDERIKKLELKGQQAGQAAAPFKYELNVRTPADRPLRLVSNLVEAPVPIDLKVRLASGEPMSGDVHVREFPIEAFRRKGKVDHFNLQLQEPSDEGNINGLLRVPYADYTVSVILLGTVAKPEVKLASDPPLPEDQLTSLLLFGQSPDELEPGDSTTVGNAQLAFSQGAIGLASLYLLASTPVQSIGYDPSTGQYSAKIRLAEGTSFNLGGEQGDLNRFGIRRRLGARWSITTELDQPSGDTQRKAQALLEWRYRY